MNMFGQKRPERFAASSRLHLFDERGALLGIICVGGDVYQPVKGIKSKSILSCFISQIWLCGVSGRDVEEEECVCFKTASKCSGSDFLKK